MDRPPLSLMELRRVHRRLRRWGRDLPYEEFAGWRLDREATRRTWREVHRRQRLSFVYGTVAVVVLTAAMTGPLPELTRRPLRLPTIASLHGDAGTRVAVATTAATMPVPPEFKLPEPEPREPAPAEPAASAGESSGVPSAPGGPPGAAPVAAASGERGGSAEPAEPEAASGAGYISEFGAGEEQTRAWATIASVKAEALREHAAAATVIVAGRVEALVDDAVVVRVELALKGEVTDVVHIAVPSAATSLAGLEPGSRLLAYLEQLETGDGGAADGPPISPLTLRPAGRHALIGLTPLTSPQR